MSRLTVTFEDYTCTNWTVKHCTILLVELSTVRSSGTFILSFEMWYWQYINLRTKLLAANRIIEFIIFSAVNATAWANKVNLNLKRGENLETRLHNICNWQGSFSGFAESLPLHHASTIVRRRRKFSCHYPFTSLT